MWERWKAGWTLHQIAHLFDRSHESVRGILAQTGGIRPPEGEFRFSPKPTFGGQHQRSGQRLAE